MKSVDFQAFGHIAPVGGRIPLLRARIPLLRARIPLLRVGFRSSGVGFRSSGVGFRSSGVFCDSRALCVCFLYFSLVFRGLALFVVFIWGFGHSVCFRLPFCFFVNFFAVFSVFRGVLTYFRWLGPSFQCLLSVCAAVSL